LDGDLIDKTMLMMKYLLEEVYMPKLTKPSILVNEFFTVITRIIIDIW